VERLEQFQMKNYGASRALPLRHGCGVREHLVKHCAIAVLLVRNRRKKSDPSVLTIGRRFATYKRATLWMRI